VSSNKILASTLIGKALKQSLLQLQNVPKYIIEMKDIITHVKGKALIVVSALVSFEFHIDKI
jgi:hypothetical protein